MSLGHTFLLTDHQDAIGLQPYYKKGFGVGGISISDYLAYNWMRKYFRE